MLVRDLAVHVMCVSQGRDCICDVCLHQANSELVYKSQGFEELEGKMEELREANKQLRDINEVMSSKLQIVEQVRWACWSLWLVSNSSAVCSVPEFSPDFLL